MNKLPEVPDWGREQYQTPEPFEWLYAYRENKFVMMQLRDAIKEKAGAAGVKNFVSKWNAFLAEKRKSDGRDIDNVTCFDGQPEELYCGEYACDDAGVTCVDYAGREVIVCRHPILPVSRLVNIDTGEVKLEIAFKRGRRWQFKIFDKGTLASANRIVELSKYGVAVDSENAKELVKYITFLEAENYDKIGETSSVGRLGWIADHGFSPYVESLKYDGELSYRHMFESVQERGSREAWMDLAGTVRASDKLIARILLAASFASALVEPCGGLPFFVHTWGGTEAGKTVGLMLAASVWANPSMGTYIHTFNSTVVGLEMLAGFCNSLPLCLDELQCIKDRKSFDNLIYMLTEGIGKGRGAKAGGLQRLQTWKNCILTTGEQPIATESSGGGAVNRIVEIDCKGERLFEDPQGVADVVRRNYGFAGRLFVETLSHSLDHARDVYKGFYEALAGGQSTEKQSMAAAIILTADALMDAWIFQDGRTIPPEALEQFLTSKADVDVNARALEWLTDFVASNPARFDQDNPGELWGIVREGYICIIKSVFDREMAEAGFSASSFLSWAKRQNLLDCDAGHATKKKWIGKMHPRCVCIKDDVELCEECTTLLE